MDEIQKLGKEVKEQIKFAKVQADLLDHELQEKERAAASRQRLKLERFVPKVENELDTIRQLQLQQSTRRSS